MAAGLSSGLEVELFEMGMWSLGLGTLGVAIVGIFLANTDLCLTKAAQASLEYLEDADLRSTGNGTRALVHLLGMAGKCRRLSIILAPNVLQYNNDILFYIHTRM